MSSSLANSDTICALATPPGVGGIGVVRISGPCALQVLMALWRGSPAPKQFTPRKLYLGTIAFPNHASRSTDRGCIDRILAVYMPAPATYTGQDVVELSAHGSPIVLRQIVEACLLAGARMAGPGEFTRRAFLAGKLDLAQAEAVCDLIHATSERGVRLAQEQLQGRLSHMIGRLSAELCELRARIEASIDFPEEEDLPELFGAGEEIERIASHLRALLATYDQGRLLREGVRVALVGRPNVGKSSLLNGLVGLDRAIVHHEPGTTRDVIEEIISLDGRAFRLRDTAGMRDAVQGVESLGIDRTREEVWSADLVLAVFDGSQPLGSEDAAVIRMIGERPCIGIMNKSDLPGGTDRSGVELPATWRRLALSAKTGAGLDDLFSHLIAAINMPGAGPDGDGALITSARQKQALEDACTALASARRAWEGREPPECVAQHLRLAHEGVGSVTGEAVSDDLLDRIFTSFCIGK